MSTARVDSVDALTEFKNYMAKFQEMGGRALGDADSDISKTQRWLEGEILNHWNNQIRKRQEALVKAEEALRHKRLYKDASGSMPSVVEEQKAVKLAKDRLENAQRKAANVKKWTRDLLKEATLYRGAVGAFSNDISSGVPQAMGMLGTWRDQLAKYVEMQAGPAGAEAAGTGAGGAGIEASEASMARAADEMPRPESGRELDPAALRELIPPAQALAGAKPAEAGPVELRCGKVTHGQSKTAEKWAAGAEPADGERVAISPGVFGAQRILLARLDPSGPHWFLGPIEGPDYGEYNTVTVGDLRQGRPDLQELLRLPVGFLAVIGSKGVEVIFDGANENMLKAAAMQEVGDGNA